MPESTERGALTEAVFYILLSLMEPMHGYGIMQNVKELSSGRVIIGAGTLYGAISTLVQKGWITPHNSDKSSRKKEYVITELGIKMVQNEIARLEELTQNGKKILGGMLCDNGYSVINIDATIICQKPKLLPYNSEMTNNIADTLGISPTCINIKATTTEGIGEHGNGAAISSMAICSLRKA